MGIYTRSKDRYIFAAVGLGRKRDVRFLQIVRIPDLFLGQRRPLGASGTGAVGISKRRVRLFIAVEFVIGLRLTVIADLANEADDIVSAGRIALDE